MDKVWMGYSKKKINRRLIQIKGVRKLLINKIKSLPLLLLAPNSHDDQQPQYQCKWRPNWPNSRNVPTHQNQNQSIQF